MPTIADVDQAEAELRAAKAHRTKDPDGYRAAADNCAAVRLAYRIEQGRGDTPTVSTEG